MTTTPQDAPPTGHCIDFHEVVQHPLDGERLLGFFVDSPRSGVRSEAAAVPLWGWVLGRTTPAVAVEVVYDGRVIRRIPVNVQRPDVAAVHSGIEGAERSGFAAALQMAGVPRIELSLQAVLQDHTRVPLASLRARGCCSESGPDLPLVSVIITCFNHARYLSEAIESVLAQTHPRLDVVVVDDGSVDNTCEVARRYPGVRVVRQANLGLPGARNTGVRHSTGDYLIFLDADDRLLPHGVAAGLDAFGRCPESAFVSGRFRFIAGDGTILQRGQGHTVLQDQYREMLRRNYIPMCATVMFRRGVFRDVGEWNPRAGSALDYDLYLRVTRRFPVTCHDAEIAEYRRHACNMSRNAVLMLRDTLGALAEQSTHVQRDRRLREAYRSGRRFWRDLYGEDAVQQVRLLVRDRRWTRALGQLGLLLRLHPRGFVELVRPGR